MSISISYCDLVYVFFFFLFLFFCQSGGNGLPLGPIQYRFLKTYFRLLTVWTWRWFYPRIRERSMTLRLCGVLQRRLQGAPENCASDALRRYVLPDYVKSRFTLPVLPPGAGSGISAVFLPCWRLGATRLGSNMGEITLPRRMFLWCMAAIYLAAFVSLYVQIPGETLNFDSSLCVCLCSCVCVGCVSLLAGNLAICLFYEVSERVSCNFTSWKQPLPRWQPVVNTHTWLMHCTTAPTKTSVLGSLVFDAQAESQKTWPTP